MEKKKSKGKLIALIIAIVVVVGVVATGIVLAATGTLFGSTKEKAFDLLKQAPEKMTQSAVSKQLGLDELSKAMLEKGMDINYKKKISSHQILPLICPVWKWVPVYHWM